MPEDVLIHAGTLHCAELRHEIPAPILDPFLYGERDGRAFAVISVLDEAAVRRVRPDVEVIDPFSLGLNALLDSGLGREEALLEVLVRACERMGVHAASVPRAFPLATADRLRAAGVGLTVDGALFDGRRRVKRDAELEGIRRAARAAEAGMAAAAAMLREAVPRDGMLRVDGQPLTAELIQAEVRATFALHGANADEFIVAPGAQGASGHDLGSGPIPAGAPVIVDLWPQDRASGCWADMTRTFVAGADPAADVIAWHNLCVDAMQRVFDATAPGVTGRDLWEVACDVFEAAGVPTQRDPGDAGEPLRDGFFHSLGHGVGLEVHEAPPLGRSGREPLVAGDVIAVEPGAYRHGYGGVRLEDLLLVTEDGAQRLTSFPARLEP